MLPKIFRVPPFHSHEFFYQKNISSGNKSFYLFALVREHKIMQEFVAIVLKNCKYTILIVVLQKFGTHLYSYKILQIKLFSDGERKIKQNSYVACFKTR